MSDEVSCSESHEYLPPAIQLRYLIAAAVRVFHLIKILINVTHKV